MREPADERLVSRAWQVLASVALLALGFSLFFNYRLFASLADPGPRAPRAVAERQAPPGDAAVPPAPIPEPRPAPAVDEGEAGPAPDAGRDPDARPAEAGGGALERSATDGYRRGERGVQRGEGDGEEDQPREERRRRRRKKPAADGGPIVPPPTDGNPYAE
jgi:hypothetical protein